MRLHRRGQQNWRRLLGGRSGFGGGFHQRVDKIQLLDDGVNDNLRHQIDESHSAVEFVDQQTNLLESLA
jgi:hypothetical protein